MKKAAICKKDSQVGVDCGAVDFPSLRLNSRLSFGPLCTVDGSWQGSRPDSELLSFRIVQTFTSKVKMVQALPRSGGCSDDLAAAHSLRGSGLIAGRTKTDPRRGTVTQWLDGNSRQSRRDLADSCTSVCPAALGRRRRRRGPPRIASDRIEFRRVLMRQTRLLLLHFYEWAARRGRQGTLNSGPTRDVLF